MVVKRKSVRLGIIRAVGYNIRKGIKLQYQGLLSMFDFDALSKFGITKETIQKYQILCLPENINSEDPQQGLYDAHDSVHLSKLLKSENVKCANSYDLKLNVQTYDRRGGEIWLGVVFVTTMLVLPILTSVIGNLITPHIKKLLHSSDKEQEPKIHIYLVFPKDLESQEFEGIHHIGSFEELKEKIKLLQSKKNENSDER